jgi:hypothetical protein
MGSYEAISSGLAQEAIMVLTHTVNWLQELLTLLLHNHATSPHLPDVPAYGGAWSSIMIVLTSLNLSSYIRIASVMEVSRICHWLVSLACLAVA